MYKEDGGIWLVNVMFVGLKVFVCVYIGDIEKFENFVKCCWGGGFCD